MNETRNSSDIASCAGRVARAYWVGAALLVGLTGASLGLQGLNYWIVGGGVVATLLLMGFGFVALSGRDAPIEVDATSNTVAPTTALVSAVAHVAPVAMAIPQPVVMAGPSESERAALAESKGLRESLARDDALLAEASTVLQAIAGGELGARMRGGNEARGEALKTSINQAADYFADLAGRIGTVAERISIGAGEIASGNRDLSGRTEQQASSLQQTASTMEEFTATVKNNADNARQADQLAGDASKIATKGGETVRRVVDTMNQISESSKRIQDIISVIDGIAFQTNILALNAAVEAARAGEQGRGFAVVAAEVRNLAQRSAAAAKEIKTLITESVDKVSDGTRFVDAAGKQIEEVVTAVKRVSDIISEITAASVEQSSGIEQVSFAVSQMDQMTQQNAALVEQSAGSAQVMRDQATELVALVTNLRGAKAYAPSRPAQPVSAGARPIVNANRETKRAVSAAPSAPRAAAPATSSNTPLASPARTPGPVAPVPTAAAPVRTKRVANGRAEAVDSWEEF